MYLRALALCLLSPLASANFSGVVTGVHDGGRIEILSQGKTVLVNLSGIALPFANQSMHSQSHLIAEKLFLNKSVQVITKNDAGGSCIYGEIFSNGLNLNETILQTGFAWVYDSSLTTERNNLIDTRNRQSKIGLFLPDYHFNPQAISLPPLQLMQQCFIYRKKVPLNEQIDFMTEMNQFDGGSATMDIIWGIILGLVLWFSLFYFDKLGIDFTSPFRKNKK